MPAIVKLGIDKKKVDAGLKQIEKDAKRTGKRVNDELSKATSPGKVAKGGLDNAKAGLEVAGLSGDKFGKIGAFAGALGPMALAGAAIGAVWQAATVAIEKYKKRLAEATEQAKKHLDLVRKNGEHVQKWTAESGSGLETLLGLSKKYSLSHVEMNEAADVLEKLKDRYGELDIRIDKTTRQVYISGRAMRRIAESNRDMLVRAKKDEYEALQKQYEALENQAKQRFTSSEDAEKFRKEAADLIPKINAARVAMAQVAQENDPEKFISRYWRQYRAERNDKDEAEAKVEAEKKAREEQERQLQLAKERAELEKKAADFRKTHNDQIQDMRDRIAILQGRGQDVARERALRDAREKKGADLTEEESAKVSSLSDLMYRLENLPSQNIPQMQINDLTARGGFASAGTSAADRVSQAISDNSAKANILLNKIEQRLEKMGFVQ